MYVGVHNWRCRLPPRRFRTRYVYIYILIKAYIHIYIHLEVIIYVFTHIHVYMYISTCLYVHICVYICVYMCPIYVSMSMSKQRRDAEAAWYEDLLGKTSQPPCAPKLSHPCEPSCLLAGEQPWWWAIVTQRPCFC